MAESKSGCFSLQLRLQCLPESTTHWSEVLSILQDCYSAKEQIRLNHSLSFPFSLWLMHQWNENEQCSRLYLPSIRPLDGELRYSWMDNLRGRGITLTLQACAKGISIVPLIFGVTEPFRILNFCPLYNIDPFPNYFLDTSLCVRVDRDQLYNYFWQ